ncbi:hypothetical protein CYLTODRAFT_489998 [Cylindrobasidium torrendii FP15055 ss-10]|uniref:Peptidase C14 caspase domain-containing protein n=1 Tax=Cylindrobasidium torrendii FP15055 ss-10 TaxID=1314674 RepID=A0A0D7BF17_9AGAR|nr:hypothetical protein CYLTODRAFT_489998 [Cylindrobasidium torrendii FP15055 ss-10]
MKTPLNFRAPWPFRKRSGGETSLASESVQHIVSPPEETRDDDEQCTYICVSFCGLFMIRRRRPTSPEQNAVPTNTDTQTTVVSVQSPSRSRPLRAAPSRNRPIISSASRVPKILALLIGINYKSTEQPQATHELTVSHQNVKEIQALLVEAYQYDPANITVMLDIYGIDPSLQPTRKNILRQIDTFVSAGSARDHFFFLYCGHTDQVQNDNNTEEDGMDECLIPLPCEEDMAGMFIRDNVLKEKLVDALPKRSQLIAVFDSCHSASLLDLDHFRCNRVYVPWLSKGRRRSDSIWNRIVRRNAMDSPTEESGAVAMDQTSETSAHSAPSQMRAMQKQRQERYRQARGRSKQKLMTLGLPYQYAPPIQLGSSARMTSPLPSPSPLRTSVPKHDLPISSTTTLPCTSGETTPVIYDSPQPLWACDGLCDPDHFSLDGLGALRTDETPLVLAFGACKDDQQSWEDADGSSMSTALVDILSGNPNPTLSELMSLLSVRMHSHALKRHLEWKDYKQRWKAYLSKGGKRKSVKSTQPQDIDNFQDPQLSSIRPLDMQQRFTP